jgi:beta-glucanase (GH16 family)
MTTLADVQKAQADLATLTAQINAASAGAQKLVSDLAVIVADLNPGPTPPVPPSGMPAPPGFKTLVLDDTFANLANWNEFYGPGVRWDNRGNLPAPYSGGNQPGSNDVAFYGPGQVTLGPNGVTLTAVQSAQFQSQGYAWASGCLTSKTPMPNGEWFVQVNAKMPDTSAGMWPALWFLPANSTQEYDGYEGGWLGASPNEQGHSDIFAASGQQQNVWSAGVDLSADFHRYGFQFVPGSPGMVAVYLDGPVRWNKSVNLSQEAYYLFLQLQVAGPSTAGWHTTRGQVPGSMEIAEVQIWTP